MAAITRNQIDLNQGITDDRQFGYVADDEGGFFFTWLDSLDDTLNSVEVDQQDGAGGLDDVDVREFLSDYLPTTGMGRELWT